VHQRRQHRPECHRSLATVERALVAATDLDCAGYQVQQPLFIRGVVSLIWHSESSTNREAGKSCTHLVIFPMLRMPDFSNTRLIPGVTDASTSDFAPEVHFLFTSRAPRHAPTSWLLVWNLF